MNRWRLPRLCAHTLAVIVLGTTATFCVARGPELGAGSTDSASLSATHASTPAAILTRGSKPATSFVTAVRPAKERRAAVDALLLGAGLVATLRISRRRIDRRLRDRCSISAFFARRRGPPLLTLAR